jgi:hypothetical protein
LKLEILAKYDSFGKLWFSTERWFSQDCRSGFELRAKKVVKKKKKKKNMCVSKVFTPGRWVPPLARTCRQSLQAVK